jgi:hypothetical protein
MRKQANALKVCPIPDACLLVMAQRPYRLLGSPETRSLIFLIKNSPDQVEGYLDYLQPYHINFTMAIYTTEGALAERKKQALGHPSYYIYIITHIFTFA